MSLGLCDSECKFALSCPLKVGREQIFTLIHGNLESQIPSLHIKQLSYYSVPYYPIGIQGVPSASEVGWDDLNFECSTFCPILSGLRGIWLKRLVSWAR